MGVYALQKKQQKKPSTCKPLCPLAPAECSPLTITMQSATRGPTVRAPGVALWKCAHVLVLPNSEREENKASAGGPAPCERSGRQEQREAHLNKVAKVWPEFIYSLLKILQ